jgi:hypothetical protein
VNGSPRLSGEGLSREVHWASRRANKAVVENARIKKSPASVTPASALNVTTTCLVLAPLSGVTTLFGMLTKVVKAVL